MKKEAIIYTLIGIIILSLIGAAVHFVFFSDNSANSSIKIANPASKYCIDNGGKLEIRTNGEGSQTGYCIFPDGKECEEWTFFNKSCTK